MTGRRLAAGLVALALLAVAARFWLLAPAAADAPGAALAPAPPPQLTAEDRAELISRMQAQLAGREPVAPPAAIVAADGTWALRFIDARSRQAVVAVRILAAGRGEVARSDAAGEATVPALPLGRLVFAAPGYLAKILQPGETDADAARRHLEAGEAARIELDRDEWTLPCALRFVAGGAAPGGPVRCVVTCRDDPPPSGASFPRGRVLPGEPVAPAAMTAWQRHVLAQSVIALAGGEAAAGLPPLHLGVLSHDRVFQTGDGAELELRFAAPGRYRVDAVAAAAGLAGQAEFRVDLGAAGPVEVDLRPGRFVTGVVVAAGSDRPVVDATVQLVESTAAAVRVVQTDAGGRFGVGPVTGAGDTVVVGHPAFAEARLPAVPGEPMRVVLSPRPLRTVAGVVLARPAGGPVAGARVALVDLGVATDAAVTADDGRFRLQTASDTARLQVRAEGYLTYVEMLGEPPAGGYTCELVPATEAARVAAGMTGIVAGRVENGRGDPVAGLPVQLFAADDSGETPLQGIAGRTVLQGGLPPLQPLAITDEQGRFSIEWGVAGPARLVPTDGVSGVEDAISVQVVLGRRSDGHVLRSRD